MKMGRGEVILHAVPALQTGITMDAEGKTLVDITAEVTQEVLDEIGALGGEVVSSFAQYHAIRARMPLDQLETLARLPQVQSIQPEEKAMTHVVTATRAALRWLPSQTTFKPAPRTHLKGLMYQGSASLAIGS